MNFKKGDSLTVKAVLKTLNRHPWGVIYALTVLLGAWLASGLEITLEGLGVGILIICFVWAVLALTQWIEDNK